MFWPPYNPLAKEGEKHLNIEYLSPVTSIAVMSPEEAEEFLQNLYADFGEKVTSDNIKNYGGLAGGIHDAYKTAAGLGGLGVQASTKNIHGKDWVIIKNFRRHQQTIMRGNKWKANNPRIIELGLGLSDIKGAARFVRFNAGMEVLVSVGINAADFILRDEATLSEFAGNSAGDLVKGFTSMAGAAALTVWAATTFPATAAVLATGTIFAVTSFLIGNRLDYFDTKYGFSDSLVDAVREYLK